MSLLRTLPTGRLVALLLAVAAIAAGGTAIALGAVGGGPVPPAKPLARAVHDAIAAPEVNGITARITFTNKLIDSSSLEGGGPLLKGAKGRLWLGDGHKLRLELQTDNGDAQIVSDGTAAWVYDSGSHTVYRGKLPQQSQADKADGKLPTLAEVQEVLDIGAGTGKLTRPLLERGLQVIAVEPITGMRAILKRTAPAADVRAGQAEALPLRAGDVDGVAGQAFHWFANAATLREFARVLLPDGRLGLIWNRRDLDQPLQAAIERLVAPYSAGSPAHPSEAWRAAFTAAAPFEPAAEHRIARAQTFDADGLVDRVLSISFIAALPSDERRLIEASVRELAVGTALELRYVAELGVYVRRSCDFASEGRAALERSRIR
jgi:SAM-dependent methyltransferase